MQPLEWRGDLDDDCSCVVGDYLLRCEAMEGSPNEWWWVGVYHQSQDVFSSTSPPFQAVDLDRAIGDSPLDVRSGSAARWLAETVMLADMKRRGI